MSNLKMAHLIFYQKNIDWGMEKFLHSVTFEMLTSSKNLPCVQAKSERKKGFCYISTKSCQSKPTLLIHEWNHFPQIDVWKSPKLLKEAISHKTNDTVKLIKQVLTTIFRNRLLHYWFSHHIFSWKWSSECSNATRNIPHKPNDTRKLTFRRDDNNLSQSIDALLIQSSHFFLKMKV